MPTQPSKQLVTFPNPKPGRPYLIRHVCPEYTALCPVTGQPDFGTIVVRYVPDRLCVELKSLKLYIWSFRDEGHFFEQVTNQILDDLVRAVQPVRMTVVGRFNVRGGIETRVVARYAKRAVGERSGRVDRAARREAGPNALRPRGARRPAGGRIRHPKPPGRARRTSGGRRRAS